MAKVFVSTEMDKRIRLGHLGGCFEEEIWKIIISLRVIDVP